MNCPRCGKDTHGGYIHTCTPTEGWRKMETEIAELKRQLEEALRVTFDPKVLDQMNVMQRQLAESQAREAKLREFSLDQWWYSELKSLLDFPEITDDAKRAIIGVIPNLIGQIQALPHDDTALKEYRDAVIEECAKVCDAQANEPECPERAKYCAGAIRKLKGAA